MPRRKPTGRTRRVATRVARPSLPTLLRRVARLEAELARMRAQHARRLAGVRRGADRRLAAMVQEIAQLRHHQARAEALTRLVTERDAQLAALTPHAAAPGGGEPAPVPAA